MNANPSIWRDRRVLVTGATGIVGSWLCKRLVEERANVVVLDGAVIRKGAVIAAGSVVRGEIPAFEIHAGSPTRRIGRRGGEAGGAKEGE